jgi:DNA polymerase/3'-5' exonuclease PolX
MVEAMKLEQARKIAESLRSDLEPYCERIEIGGSIRRRKLEVKDIELVVIPKFGDFPTGQMSLDGDPLTSYENLLFEHIAANREEYRIIKMGVKYAQIHKSSMMIDVFTATPETWGYIFLLRTGPAEFSKWVVTELKKRGYTLKRGAVWATDSLGLLQCDTPSERDVFRMLGIDWIEPEYRFKDVSA